jgi:hypothetical protein
VKSTALTEFSHKELTLLLFALDGAGGSDGDRQSPPSCEESCPVVENIEELFSADTLPADKRLARHLGNHLREALIECGMFELMGAAGQPLRATSAEERALIEQVNERLRAWRCEIKLSESDRRMLYESIARLPRSAWFGMPGTLWRLRKKLKAR